MQQPGRGASQLCCWPRPATWTVNLELVGQGTQACTQNSMCGTLHLGLEGGGCRAPKRCFHLMFLMFWPLWLFFFLCLDFAMRRMNWGFKSLANQEATMELRLAAGQREEGHPAWQVAQLHSPACLVLSQLVPGVQCGQVSCGLSCWAALCARCLQS